MSRPPPTSRPRGPGGDRLLRRGLRWRCSRRGSSPSWGSPSTSWLSASPRSTTSRARSPHRHPRGRGPEPETDQHDVVYHTRPALVSGAPQAWAGTSAQGGSSAVRPSRSPPGAGAEF
ncbi:hypothetical protein QJS66_14670 [Kocuria rhizophila]|nr:hypothetical protein QJS66_14670 [Kocuria rhizophila]